MKPEELAVHCMKSIKRAGENGFAPTISLNLPESKKRTRERFLAGLGSPKGKVVSFGLEGCDVVVFDAIDVLAYLVATGVVAVTITGDKDEKHLPDNH